MKSFIVTALLLSSVYVSAQSAGKPAPPAPSATGTSIITPSSGAESGSTMTQQRMEEDRGHERFRDANRRGKRYQRLNNPNPPKKL